MQKQIIIMSLVMVFMVLCMAGSVFAQDQAIDANKTANVTGIDTATVTIEVNGSSNSTRLPADVVFTIDASGSMSTSDPTGLRKTAAINFINKMNNTTDEVGVINWADTIKQQLGLTSNFNQAITVVNQNTPGGTTNGALAMQTSINILSSSSLPASQRFIIFLTDGLFNVGGNSSMTPDQRAIFFANQAKSLGYTIYTIGLGPDVDASVLTSMASIINGVPQYYFANNATVLDQIYNQIFQSITTKAKNITVTDVVPSYMTYVNGSATKTPTTNVLNPDGTRTLTWYIPTLGQGQTWNVSYQLMTTINGYNIPTNVVANITYTDPNNNTGNLTLPIPKVNFPANLNATKEGDPEPAWAGTLLTYEMSIINDGPHTAWNVSFSDTLPVAFLNSVEYSLNNINWNPYTSGQNVTLGNLMVGQTVHFWIRGIVNNPILPGTFTNTVYSYLNGTLSKNATFISTIIPAADLAIIKTANQTENLVAGQNVTITLKVTNNGPNTAHNVIVNDPRPYGITSYGTGVATKGSWNPSNGIWDGFDLAFNEVATLTFNATINITFPVPGNITNIANVTGDEFDPNPLNNQDLVVLYVQQQHQDEADLTIDKFVNNPTPNLGDTIQFTINVFNAGPDPAQNVLVTDLWPAGLIFVNSNPTYNSFIGNIITWNLGTINHEENKTIYINATVNATGLITNFVNVTTTTYDPHGDNNATANVTVNPAAHVVLDKIVSNSTPNYWSLVTFTINAHNTGPNTAEGVQVTDMLPAGLTYVSSLASPLTTYNSTSGIWNIGTLIFGGADATLQIVANVTGIGNITNWAYVTNQTTFDNQTWSSDNATVTVREASIFTLNKEWRATEDGTPITQAQYEDNVWIVFSATNLGPNDTGITLSDTLPAGFLPANYWQYKWDSGSWTNYPVTWSGAVTGIVTVGSTLWIAIPGNITVANTTLNNIVIQTYQNTTNPNYPNGPPYGNASAQLNIPPHSHVVITKTVNNTTPNFGDTIIFTVTAHNNGPNDAVGESVTDILPPELIYVTSIFSPGTTYNSNTGIWNIPTLLNGTSVTLNITAIVNGTGTIINWANEANATINVPPAAHVVLTKTVNNTTPNYGDNITFTITAHNNGPNDAQGVQVTDVLPTGLSYVSDTGGGTYNSGTGIWNIGTLIFQGTDAILNITAKVIGTGTITNWANVTNQTTHDNQTWSKDNETINVPPAASLVITKTANPPILTVGQPVTFTVKVTNNGPDTATGVFVNDKLPSGLTYQSSSATKGSYNSGTGVWTIGSMLTGTSETLTLIALVEQQGSYTNTATAGSESYNPNVGNNSSTATVVGQDPNIPNAAAAVSTIPLQKTGLPVAYIALAVLMVLAGYVIPKRK